MVSGVALDAPSFEPPYGRPMSAEEWEQMGEDEPGEDVDLIGLAGQERK